MLSAEFRSDLNRLRQTSADKLGNWDQEISLDIRIYRTYRSTSQADQVRTTLVKVAQSRQLEERNYESQTDRD